MCISPGSGRGAFWCAFRAHGRWRGDTEGMAGDQAVGLPSMRWCWLAMMLALPGMPPECAQGACFGLWGAGRPGRRRGCPVQRVRGGRWVFGGVRARDVRISAAGGRARGGGGPRGRGAGGPGAGSGDGGAAAAAAGAAGRAGGALGGAGRPPGAGRAGRGRGSGCCAGPGGAGKTRRMAVEYAYRCLAERRDVLAAAGGGPWGAGVRWSSRWCWRLS